MMKKVIVTGATSMLGAALVKRLLQSKSIEKIYAIVRPKQVGTNENKRQRLPADGRIQLIECDIKDYASLPSAIDSKCDVFYHMAWPRTATYEENISDILLKCDAMKCVVEAVNAAHALGCSKFVGAGSQSEYGVPENGCYTSKMECRPVRIDGVLHLAAGQMAQMAAEQFKMTCVWMRIFSVYGVNDRKNSMVNSTIDKMMSGAHCAFTKSEQTWDYVYADDVADAFYLVGEKVRRHAVYNIAFGISRPLKEYIEIIRDVVAPDAELGFGEIKYPANPIMKMEVDVSELMKDTGWKPKIGFEQGIRQIYETRITGSLLSG